ncbi:Cro/Cl family transcriptional regulator [Pontibacillus marinus BH030004 = DSM 16465]|uniref:Cro/Cl family transcriptional regulator n=2 Tax=Pontibacillus TaxID=289201 RepID=A0A0A5G8F4_9BACI|nr:Cro/Cl family transcriptional regulator [Pontibacillus marinus BH030004 = DSM 16465]
MVVRVVDFNISENITYFRQKYDWSQTQLAEKLNISRSTVSKYESGRQIPDLNTLKRISEVFDTTLDQLVGLPLPKDALLREFEQVYQAEEQANISQHDMVRIINYLYMNEEFTEELLRLLQLPKRKQNVVHSSFQNLTSNIDKL